MNHTAEAAHLLFGYIVVGMVFKTAPQHFAYFRVSAQVFGNGFTVFAMALHTYVQCFYTTQHQPAIVRTGYRPATVLYKCQPLMQFTVVHHQRAHYHIAVTAEVLGCRVHDDIHAGCERLLEQRSCPAVVHAAPRTVIARQCGNRFHIQRVTQHGARAFEPHQLRVRAERSALSVLVILSALGGMTGIILSGPRVYLAMAQDGLLFRWFGAVHPRYRTPHIAIVDRRLAAYSFEVRRSIGMSSTKSGSPRCSARSA